MWCFLLSLFVTTGRSQQSWHAPFPSGKSTFVKKTSSTGKGKGWASNFEWREQMRWAAEARAQLASREQARTQREIYSKGFDKGHDLPATCGNGLCDIHETVDSCAQDCADFVSTCAGCQCYEDIYEICCIEEQRDTDYYCRLLRESTCAPQCQTMPDESGSFPSYAYAPLAESPPQSPPLGPQYDAYNPEMDGGGSTSSILAISSSHSSTSQSSVSVSSAFAVSPSWSTSQAHPWAPPPAPISEGPYLLAGDEVCFSCVCALDADALCCNADTWDDFCDSLRAMDCNTHCEENWRPPPSSVCCEGDDAQKQPEAQKQQQLPLAGKAKMGGGPHAACLPCACANDADGLCCAPGTWDNVCDDLAQTACAASCPSGFSPQPHPPPHPPQYPAGTAAPPQLSPGYAETLHVCPISCDGGPYPCDTLPSHLCTDTGSCYCDDLCEVSRDCCYDYADRCKAT